MEFTVNYNPGRGPAVIICPRRLDINNSDRLRKILDDLIKQACYQIVLDMEGTKYMDSSGLGAIVSRIADLRAKSGDIRVAGTPPNITELFRLTHLNKIIHLFGAVPEARKSFTE